MIDLLAPTTPVVREDPKADGSVPAQSPLTE